MRRVIFNQKGGVCKSTITCNLAALRNIRDDASDTAIPGAGLGMSIVKYIVEAHGGKVWVESEFQKGTTVRFIVPR